MIKFFRLVEQVLQQDFHLLCNEWTQGLVVARVKELVCTTTQDPEVLAIMCEGCEILHAASKTLTSKLIRSASNGLHFALKNKSRTIGVVRAPLFQDIMCSLCVV